jgi:hypothetical protein
MGHTERLMPPFDRCQDCSSAYRDSDFPNHLTAPWSFCARTLNRGRHNTTQTLGKTQRSKQHRSVRRRIRSSFSTAPLLMGGEAQIFPMQQDFGCPRHAHKESSGGNHLRSILREPYYRVRIQPTAVSGNYLTRCSRIGRYLHVAPSGCATGPDLSPREECTGARRR